LDFFLKKILAGFFFEEILAGFCAYNHESVQPFIFAIFLKRYRVLGGICIDRKALAEFSVYSHARVRFSFKKNVPC